MTLSIKHGLRKSNSRFSLLSVLTLLAALLNLSPLATHAAGSTTVVNCSTSGNFKVITIGTDVLAVDGASCTGVAEIPAGVTTIDQLAFLGAGITLLTIPASVSSIGYASFANASGLQTVIIEPGSALKFIGMLAFGNDSNLASIDFGSGSQVTTIAEQAFRNTGLSSLVLPASIEYIKGNAFEACPNLLAVSFKSNSRLRSIGSDAFDGRVSLTLPTLPVRTGFNFLGWSGSGPNSVESLWAQPSFEVTFDAKSGTTVSPGSFVSGGSITEPPAPTRAGYTFAGWSATTSGSAEVFPYSPNVESALTLHALWTEDAPPTLTVPTISVGSTPDSQVATIPVGLTAAELPATATLPKVTLNFAATSASATATVAPIENPAAASATPFAITGTTKIVDIQVTNVTGPVTVCLDGAPTDEVFHFTGGAWVALPNRTYVNGQVCGVTTNFSPFAAAEPRALTPVASSGPTGPRLTIASRVAVTTNGQSLALKGVQLSEILSIKLDGKDVTVIRQTDGELVIQVPAGAEGFPDLQMTHAGGTLTYYRMIQIIKPYELTRSIKITKFVGSRPTLAGLSALYKVYRADMSVNVLTCVITVASDASGEGISNAEFLGKSTCQRVVNYSREIKSAQTLLKKDGAVGSKPVVEITFDRTLSPVRG
jgi:uncharacterized repeat protein (TIGR02543 family)